MRTLSVLLVDDDRILLSDLKTIVNWEEQGFHVLTASNGVQALNVYKNQRPDIVLTDIMMPGMDGLELLSKIKAIDSYTCVILLSSYDDFSFAKKGLQLGAEDYILKNELTREYMYEKLSAVRAHVKQKYDHRFYLLSNAVKNYLNEEIVFPSEYLRSDPSLQTFFEAGHYYIIIEYPVPFFDTSSVKYINSELLSVPENKLSEVFFIESSSEISDHQLLLSLQLKSNVSELQLHSEITALCRTLMSKNEAVCRDLTFIYVNTPRTLQQLRDKLDSFSIKKRRFTRIRSGFYMISFSDLHSEGLFGKPPLSSETLTELIMGRDASKLKIQAGNFLDWLKNAEGFVPDAQFIDALYHAVCKKADEAVLPQPSRPNVYNYAELFDWLFIQMDELSSDSSDREAPLSEPIKSAIRYISQNYNNPGLSVNEIASFVHLSDSYLCTLFKNETKKKLVSFITETRINNARILLRETDLPINTIASMCGYTTSQYFSSAFSKYTKMTPKEYRRR